MTTESAYICAAGSEDFEQKVLQASAEQPVLVDFWADWCGPCKTLMPILAGLAEAYAGKFLLVKVNSDEQQELAMRYGVRSLPTVKVFKHGEVVDEFMGALPESQVRAFIDRHIVHESDRTTDQANELYQQGQHQEAIKILSDTIEAGAATDRPILKLAEFLADQKRYSEAEETLEKAGRETRESPEYKRLHSRIRFGIDSADAPDMATLQTRIQDNPDDLEARSQLGALLVAQQDYQAAMEQYLEIVRRDRKYGNDAGRSALLDLFTLLGNTDPRVKKYRRALALALN